MTMETVTLKYRPDVIKDYPWEYRCPDCGFTDWFMGDSLYFIGPTNAYKCKCGTFFLCRKEDDNKTNEIRDPDEYLKQQRDDIFRSMW